MPKHPDGGETRSGAPQLDRLAGLAGKLAEADAQDDVAMQQRQAGSATRKRNAIYPVYAPGNRGAASAGAGVGATAADATPHAHTRAGKRNPKTARKAANLPQLAAVPATEKPRRGRPRKSPQPTASQDAPVPPAAQPPAAVRLPAQVAAARIAHPDELMVDAPAVDAAPRAQAPQAQPAPRPTLPVLGMGPGLPVRRRVQRRASPAPPRRSPAAQPAHHTPSPEPRAEREDTESSLETDDEWDLVSANSMVGQYRKRRRPVIDPDSIAEWVSKAPGAAPPAAAVAPAEAAAAAPAQRAATAVPLGLGIGLGPARARAPARALAQVPPGRRIAHAELLPFAALLPPAPRGPVSVAETRAGAARPRELADEEAAEPAAPVTRGARAKQAAAANKAAEAAQEVPVGAGQAGDVEAAAAVHHRAPQSPAGSSKTAAPMPEEADEAAAGAAAAEEPDQAAQRPAYPGSHKRRRRDKMRALDTLVRELPQFPAPAANARPRRAAAANVAPEAAAAATADMQPRTPAGLPVRAELGADEKGKGKARADEGDPTEVEDASMRAAWQLRGAATPNDHEAGPSNPGGAGGGSETAEATGRGAGKEPSPKRRCKGKGAAAAAAPLAPPAPPPRCLRMQASGAMAVSTEVTPEAEEDPDREMPPAEEQPEGPQPAEEPPAAPAAEQAAPDAPIENGDAAADEEEEELPPEPEEPLPEGNGELLELLLQRMAEEASLGQETSSESTTFCLAEEGLTHLRMQYGRQEGLVAAHRRAEAEMHSAMEATTRTSKAVLDKRNMIQKMEEELKHEVAAAESARLSFVNAARRAATLKEDLEKARADVLIVLQSPHAELAQIHRSMTAQAAHVKIMKAACKARGRRLQSIRNDVHRILLRMGWDSAANAPADKGAAGNAPADNAPADNAPADDGAAGNAPADNAAAGNGEADNGAAVNGAADNAPADNGAADIAPGDNAPAANAPADDGPADNTPADNRAADDGASEIAA